VKGVVIVREMTISFANIQDVAITQGAIERMLGPSNVRVTTAGGRGGHSQNKPAGPNLHNAWFRGIDNADEVKNLILERLRALKDSGLGHREEECTHPQRQLAPPSGMHCRLYWRGSSAT
jgi:uncharacterized membrane protein YdbT with pleckstrin-like domain